MTTSTRRRRRIVARIALLAACLLGCSGSTNGDLFGPCDAGEACAPGLVINIGNGGHDDPRTNAAPDASRSWLDGGSGPRMDASTTDAAVGGTCARDIECPGALCNRSSNTCALPAENDARCARDIECQSALCNRALNRCQ